MVALHWSFYEQAVEDCLERGINNRWAKDLLFEAECRLRRARVAGRPGMIAGEIPVSGPSGVVMRPRETPGRPAAQAEAVS